MLLFAGVLNLLSSYLIASVAGNLLATYVIFFGLIILNLEILSLFSGIYAQNIVIFSILNLICSILFFKYKKGEFLKPKIDFKKVKNALFLDKSLIILSVAFLILITISGILAFVMPPLEPDSQTYHFFRAYMFYENHNLAHFDINDARALIMPFNSEIIYTWILCLKNKLYNFALLSYFSYFAIISATWQILSHLKYSIRKKLFAIFLFSSLASVVIQMSCLQTDIVIGALTLCAFSLFLRKNIYLSSLSLALALGTKTTAFVIFIPFLIIIYVLNKKDFKSYIACFILNFIIFSSYNYILNLIQFQNPFTNTASYYGHKFWGGFQGYIANLIHFNFQLFDFTGFTWGFYVNNKLFAFKNLLFNILHINSSLGSNVAQGQINITTDEQIIGFGILGFLALVPAIIRGLFSKKRILFLLSISFILNILILSRLMAYMEYSIRFVLSFAAFSSPIFVLLYNKRGLYKFLLCFFAIFYMAILPYHIRRAPAYKIFPYLIKNKFNMEQFVEDCYEGKIITIWGMTPAIRKIIEDRYPNAKKIGYFKTTSSSALYLKTLFNIDFLTASKIDEYDLGQYDLIIFENETQDDNIFNSLNRDYIIKDESVKFLNDGINCYYARIGNNKEADNDWATTRICLGTFYFKKNKNFKNDYVFEYIDKNSEKTNIYFFTKKKE